MIGGWLFLTFVFLWLVVVTLLVIELAVIVALGAAVVLPIVFGARYVYVYTRTRRQISKGTYKPEPESPARYSNRR